MKILSSPVFWREKTETINSGAVSVVSVLLQLFVVCTTMWVFSLLVKDFWFVLLIGWFSLVTNEQSNAARVDDIEAIMATPLGVKDFAKGRSLFSECKSFLYAVLAMPFLYYNKPEQIFSPKPLSVAIFLVAPFFIYYWALFVNMVCFFVPARFSILLILPVYAPFCALLLGEPARSIVLVSVVPALGTLAFIASRLSFKFIPKEIIRNRALRD
ncbi:MAG: hypothetical protein LBB04_02695 [Oscillospiraceae bacterium]|jgi:hypothetical protein|nr:hypothetical protein [Oscillospiraceae bacterium]